jgi:hypothetical protein
MTGQFFLTVSIIVIIQFHAELLSCSEVVFWLTETAVAVAT